MSFRRSFADQLLSIARSVFADAEVHPAGVTPSKAVTHYIAYQRISSVHARHMGGGSSLVNPRYTVTAWAKKAADANRLSEAVRLYLDNRRGDIGDAGDTEYVNGSFLSDDNDMFEPPQDASQSGWHGVGMDFNIWHGESESPSP